MQKLGAFCLRVCVPVSVTRFSLWFLPLPHSLTHSGSTHSLPPALSVPRSFTFPLLSLPSLSASSLTHSLSLLDGLGVLWIASPW
jgi:hypothetical protein